MPNNRALIFERGALIASFVFLVIWSWIDPADRLTWWLEALPPIFFIAILALAWRYYRPTRITQWLIYALCVMMVIGAHYTYGDVPPFNWLRDELDLSRNHYDRVSHFLQGVTVSMLARELLVRETRFDSAPLLFITVAAATLGVSAGCELAEWLAAEVFGGGATAFLGMQGDQWDAQKDMALALAGAVVTQLLLARPQDRQIAALRTSS